MPVERLTVGSLRDRNTLCELDMVRLRIKGTVAKRFIVNAREWITNRSQELTAQNGTAAPVVHDFQACNELKAAVRSNAKLGMVVTIGVVLFIGLLIVYQAWWAAVATAAIEFLIWRQATKRV
jgi:hypothetical protein